MRGKGEGGIYKTAEGLWTASLELPAGPDGKRRRKVKKSRDKAVVVRWLAEQRAEYETRGDLTTSSPTLKAWSEYWVANVAAKRVRPNTIYGYRAGLRHLTDTIGNVRLDKLTPAHIRRAEDAMLAAGFSSTTALLAHRVLRKALEDARREGLVLRNAADLMDAPRKAPAKVHALSLGQAIEVVARAVPALKAEPYDPLPALWATYLLTGARRGEILGLEWDRVGEELDLSWQLQYIKAGVTVPDDYEVRPIAGRLFWTRPKTRQGWRVIPLVEPLRSLLREHLERVEPNPFGLVFALEGRPIDPAAASKLWRAASPDKDVTLHGLRHTTVDLLYEAGAPEDLVMQIVGHSQAAVTRGYKTPTKIARAKAAMEQLSALILTPGRTTALPRDEAARS